jgi:hypothetical protein
MEDDVSMAYHEPLTLWRGADLLGEVVASLPVTDPAAIHGLFRPTAAFADIGRLLQARVPLYPDGLVFLSRFEGPPDPGPKPLRQMSPEEAKGLPVDEQLVLRDATGRVLPMDLISLNPYDIPEEPGPMPDLCRRHGLAGVAWLLGAFPPRHR